tara:strand:- start:433 stop:1131 length:699 start_codon:yes stop_codon:yes gene_type:complete
MIKSTKYFSLVFTLILLIGCESESFNVPGKTTLISPENVQTCETGVSISDTQSEVTFSWSESEYTDYYDLNITNLNSNSVIWSSKNKLTSDKVILVKGQPYSWKVNTRNSEVSDITSSDTWKFYLGGLGVINYAPYPAALLAPNNSATVERNSNGEISFTWEGSDPDDGDDLVYTLYVDTIDGKQTPSTSLSDLSVKTLNVALDPGTTYYWRIKTFDGKNNSYSVVRSFKTK